MPVFKTPKVLAALASASWSAADTPGLIQWHLDNGETYASAQVGGRYVLENLATAGNDALKAASEALGTAA